MPGSNDQSIQGPSDHRLLDFGAVRVHNRHLQGGRAESRGCNICSSGLEGVMPEIPKAEVKVEVAESDGGDAEGNAAPPPSDGYDRGW